MQTSDPNASTQVQMMLGAYQILEEIGSGGMGKVYKAYHQQLDKTVAIKVMIRTGPTAERERSRFLAEAQIAAKLHHPNIVPVYDVGSVEGRDFIVMEYIEGQSLDKLLANNLPSTRKAMEIMREVALAMHYAHENGIVHRDLKPANLIIHKQTGKPIVMDFGLAKNINKESNLTKSGEILGTPRYMAPEQVLPRGRVTPATDVFAMGAILYEMLTGKPTIKGQTAMNMLYALTQQAIEPPRHYNQRLAAELDIICMKALEKNPAQRYASAQAFAEDIERFLNGEAILARPGNTWQTMWHRVRKQQTAVLLSVLGFMLVLLAAGWGLFNGESRQQPRSRLQAEVSKQLRDEIDKAVRAQAVVKSQQDFDTWWHTFMQQLRMDMSALHAVASQVRKGRELLQKRYQEDEQELPSDRFILKNSDKLFTAWSELQEQVGKMPSLIERYRTLAVAFCWNRQSDPWLVERLEQKRQGVEQELGKIVSGDDNIALRIVQRWEKDRYALYLEASDNIDKYSQDHNVDHIEWARWLIAQARIYDRQHEGCARLERDILSICQQHYLQAVDRWQSEAMVDGDLVATTLSSLQKICLMNCTFVPPFYQIARIYHQLDKRQEARPYYESCHKRQPQNKSVMYALQEIYFYACHQAVHSYNAGNREPKDTLEARKKFREVRQQIKNTEPVESAQQAMLSDFYQQVIEQEAGLVEREIVNTDTNFNFFLMPHNNNKPEYKVAYQEGIALYHRLEKILEPIQEKSLLAQTWVWRGQIWLDLGMHDELSPLPPSYFERASQAFDEARKFQRFPLNTLYLLGKTHYLIADYGRVEQVYRDFSCQFARLDPAWLQRVHWDYLLCLLNQGKRQQIKQELEQYLDTYRSGNIKDRAITVKNLILSLIYIQEGQTGKAQSLLDEVYKNFQPKQEQIESIIFFILQTKLGKTDRAKETLSQSWDMQSPRFKMFPIAISGLAAYTDHFRACRDLFMSPPEYRHLPKGKERQLQQMMLIMAIKPNEMGNINNFFAEVAAFVESDPALKKSMTSLLKEITGKEMSMELLLYLSAQVALDTMEKRLLPLHSLASGELCYCRANAHYRIYLNRGLEDALAKSFDDLRAGVEYQPAEAKYHYACAVVCAELAKKSQPSADYALFHLYLARRLGLPAKDTWANDPAFSALQQHPRFVALTKDALPPLTDSSWPQLQKEMQEWQKQDSDMAYLLFKAYQAATEKNLRRHEPQRKP